MVFIREHTILPNKVWWDCHICGLKIYSGKGVESTFPALASCHLKFLSLTSLLFNPLCCFQRYLFIICVSFMWFYSIYFQTSASVVFGILEPQTAQAQYNCVSKAWLQEISPPLLVPVVFLSHNH